MKKDSTWNIKRLVNELFVPSTQRDYYIEDCRILYACIAVGLCAYKSLFQLCGTNGIKRKKNVYKKREKVVASPGPINNYDDTM